MPLAKPILATLLATVVSVSCSGIAHAFDPVDSPGSNPIVHLSLIGRYGGEELSTRSAEGPRL